MRYAGLYILAKIEELSQVYSLKLEIHCMLSSSYAVHLIQDTCLRSFEPWCCKRTITTWNESLLG